MCKVQENLATEDCAYCVGLRFKSKQWVSVNSLGKGWVDMGVVMGWGNKWGWFFCVWC